MDRRKTKTWERSHKSKTGVKRCHRGVCKWRLGRCGYGHHWLPLPGSTFFAACLGEKHREDSRENKWVVFLLRYRYEGVAARGGQYQRFATQAADFPGKMKA